MARSPLFGRRIHIAGSVDGDTAIASAEAIDNARQLVALLVPELMRRGATFVTPVDAEKLRDADQRPFCFDWLIWQTVNENLSLRPTGAIDPLAIAVQHHKSEGQIPPQFARMWDQLRQSDLVQIENAAHWNMNSKRMEIQERWGDILITLGGGEGVLFLANLYHDSGKPVIPLPDALCGEHVGSRRLFDFGLISSAAPRLFKTTTQTPHAWINRLNTVRAPIPDRCSTIIKLLEALEPPPAFVVRLMDDSHPDCKAVEDYFEGVVKPVIEGELGYRLTVVDGRQPYEHPRIDQEIFAKLQRSRLVLADLTGERPNCFLEAGFAMGRQLPTVVMCKKGGATHFDLKTVATHFWDPSATLEDRKRALRDHLQAVRDRPPLVPSEPLIS
jgi:hypothetical protein